MKILPSLLVGWAKRAVARGTAIMAIGGAPARAVPQLCAPFPASIPPSPVLHLGDAPRVQTWVDVQQRATVRSVPSASERAQRIEEEFVLRVMEAALKMPQGALLLFDWDLTVVDVKGVVRSGFLVALERLRAERPDLKIGILTSRKELHMPEVRAVAERLKLDGPILQHENIDAETHRVDWRELQRISGLDRRHVADALDQGGYPSKVLYVAEAYRGHLDSVHLFDDGKDGAAGELLHLATPIEPPIAAATTPLQ